MPYNWYAVRVRSNFEITTATFLESMGYSAFVPTVRDHQQELNRSTATSVPLFRGYVFCRFDINNRLPVLKAPGTVHIVGFGKTFASIPEVEIEAVRKFVSSPVVTQPCPYVNVGERVIMQTGPLTGIEGILIEIKKEHRLVVSVNILQRSIAAEVELEWVRPATSDLRGTHGHRKQPACPRQYMESERTISR